MARSKPKPKVPLKLTGDRTSRPASNVPAPPTFLTAAAKREWRRLYPLLVDAVWLDELDTSVLAAHCEAWATFANASKQLAKSDLVIETRHGQTMNPLLRIRRDASSELLRTAKLLGLTPASRKRLADLKAARTLKIVNPDSAESKFFA